MRTRQSARLLVFNKWDEVLLFASVHQQGPLVGQNYWFTPGGAVEPGETFEQAGVRELEEETGLKCDQIGQEIYQRIFVLRLIDGEEVEADERYFVVRPDTQQLSFGGWTDLKVELIAGHKWWSVSEIADATEIIWPENLAEMLISPEVQAGSNAQKAVSIARAYLTGRSDRLYSEGHAQRHKLGHWRVWFERRSGFMMDPIHVIVAVDLDNGECEIVPLF